MRHFQNLLSTPGRSQILLATLTLALALPTPARAAVVTTGDVDPANPATWGYSTWAYIGKTALGTLTVDGGSSVGIRFGYLGYESGSEGSATVSGNGSTWGMSRYLVVGHDGTGTLAVNSSGLVRSDYGYLGYESGSEGTATVSGSGSTWRVTYGGLYVGRYGTGTVNIHEGGLVKCADGGYLGGESGSEGTATVSGSGSTWEMGRMLYVGRHGTGTLNIQDGGLVKCRGYGGYLGGYSGSEGTATVSGSGSTWEMGRNLYVGRHGTGTLNIQDGGLVKSSGGGAYLGDKSGSEGTATVSGSGSTWEMRSSLYVGRDGMGTLNIHDGGLVKCSGYGGFLGGYSGSEGTATVSGSGSTWEVDYRFHVGFDGTGTLNILDGGLVRGDSGYLGYGSGSEGTATVSGSGSTWEMSSGLYVGRDGRGTLNIRDSGLVSVGTETYVNRSDTGSKIVFDGGTLETMSIFASPDDLQGVGTIKARGWVLDADVTVNTSTLVHSFAITDPATSKNIGFQIDQTGTNPADVGAGYRATGTLTINSGGLVKSRHGYLGYQSGSEGTAMVSGSGSTWEMDYELFVGFYGTGTLNIHDGGLAKSSSGLLGRYSGSEGTATVSGSGSTWEINGSLYVGRDNGTGTLNIQDGGLVSVGGDASVNPTSTLTFGIGSSGSGLLDVGGNVALDGAFGVTLLDGYMPGGGDSFTLIQAGGGGGISGLSNVDMMGALPSINWWLDWESDYAEASSELTISVGPEPSPFSLDIKPDSDENPLNLKSKGVLPVSILTTDEFDALSVDLETLLFGDPLLVDKTTTPLSPIRFNEGDVNDDGLMDLTLFFSIPELLDAGMLGPSSEEACLFGALFDGTDIFSSDMLSIVPKQKGKFLGAIDEAEALAMGRSASISPIPEPSTLALLCMGVFGLLMYGCRSRRVRRDAP